MQPIRVRAIRRQLCSQNVQCPAGQALFEQLKVLLLTDEIPRSLINEIRSFQYGLKGAKLSPRQRTHL